MTNLQTNSNSYAEWEAGEQNRMPGVIQRFLEPLLTPSADILSIGCGTGLDVLELRRQGYRAWGLDPSRLSMNQVPEDMQSYFRHATVEDEPFGINRFDFAYALEVIEHVGCRKFGTILEPDAHNARVRFISACLKLLKPGGRLILATSNKLFPIDPGHWHRYHRFGALFSGQDRFGLSIPWSSKNFLLSLGDIRSLVKECADFAGQYTVRPLPVAAYPSLAKKRNAAERALSCYLSFSDLPLLRGSPLAPLLSVAITKSSQH